MGISSGPNQKEAMKRRVDDYKKENNLNKMVALYEADNQQQVRKVEERLVNYYKLNDSCINRTGGGGGRPSKGPKYQVYLAFEE